MSDSAVTFDADGYWIPPETFRDGLADAERLAGDLVDVIVEEPSLLVDRQRVEFLARRLLALAIDNHCSLPPEVT